MSAVFKALGDTTNPWTTQVVDFNPKASEAAPLPWYLVKSYLQKSKKLNPDLGGTLTLISPLCCQHPPSTDLTHFAHYISSLNSFLAL
jgi:hypothetical protein